jgi:hypothetical protein
MGARISKRIFREFEKENQKCRTSGSCGEGVAPGGSLAKYSPAIAKQRTDTGRLSGSGGRSKNGGLKRFHEAEKFSE